MLKNVDPLLTPDLLAILRSMGHGDEIILVDQNFPAASIASRLVDLLGARLDAVATAVMSVLPVDRFIEPGVFRMGAVGDESTLLPVHAEFQGIVDAAEGREVCVGVLDRSPSTNGLVRRSPSSSPATSEPMATSWSPRVWCGHQTPCPEPPAPDEGSRSTSVPKTCGSPRTGPGFRSSCPWSRSSAPTPTSMAFPASSWPTTTPLP